MHVHFGAQARRALMRRLNGKMKKNSFARELARAHTIGPSGMEWIINLLCCRVSPVPPEKESLKQKIDQGTRWRINDFNWDPWDLLYPVSGLLFPARPCPSDLMIALGTRSHNVFEKLTNWMLLCRYLSQCSVLQSSPRKTTMSSLTIDLILQWMYHWI